MEVRVLDEFNLELLYVEEVVFFGFGFGFKNLRSVMI